MVSDPTPSPEPIEWTGPVRARRAAVDEQAAAGESATRQWTDESGDAERGWVDITSVSFMRQGQMHWFIELAEWPPVATTLDSNDTVIAYGLVLDVNRDSVADYEVGLSNEGPRPGQFRTWLTNLASGAQEEQIGPPYGFPVEFAHPDVDRAAWEDPTVVLTFLEAPEGVLSRTVRFYAWASHTEAGEVVAWDYAPDATWLGAPPPRDLGCTEAACPELGPPPHPGARELLVEVHNQGQRRALLFVAEDRSPMGELVGTAEPALILPGARELVIFTVPAGSGWAIFVNPTDEHSTPAIVAPMLPPDGFEMVITDDGGFVSRD